MTLAPRTGIAITPPSSLQAGAPGSFTVTVGSSANVTNVKVNWGDGGTTSLGAITGSTTVQHTYNNEGSFTVTATATDSSGNSESVSTVMIVLPAPPVQVTLQASSTQPTKNQTVTFTATVGTLPAGAVIQRYDWNFGDGATTTTSSGNASHIYSTTGPKDISVTVTLSNGSAGQGLTSIVVTDSPLPVVALSPNPSTTTVGTPVSFAVTVTGLPVGVTITQYQWDFGDTKTENGTNPSIQHIYTVQGTYNAQVTVVLSDGRTAKDAKFVIVNP